MRAAYWVRPGTTGGDTMDPQEARHLEMWLRRKYEHKEFALGVSEGGALKEPKTLVNEGEEPMKV